MASEHHLGPHHVYYKPQPLPNQVPSLHPQPVQPVSKPYDENALALIHNLNNFAYPAPVRHRDNTLFDVNLGEQNGGEIVRIIACSSHVPQAYITHLWVYLFLWIWTNHRCEERGVPSGYIAGDVLLRDLGSFNLRGEVGLAQYGISLDSSIEKLYVSCIHTLKQFQLSRSTFHKDIQRHAELRLNIYIGKGITIYVCRNPKSEKEKSQLDSWRPRPNQGIIDLTFIISGVKGSITKPLTWYQICHPRSLRHIDFPPLMKDDDDVGLEARPNLHMMNETTSDIVDARVLRPRKKRVMGSDPDFRSADTSPLSSAGDTEILSDS